MIQLAHTYMRWGDGTYDLQQRIQHVDRIIVTRTQSFRENSSGQFSCRYNVEFWDVENGIRRGSVDFTTRMTGISAPPLVEEVQTPVTDEDISALEDENCTAYTDDEIQNVIQGEDE